MMKLYTCIGVEHYLPVTALAALICGFGSLVTINLFERYLHSRNSRLDWLVISGLAGGTTIWSTHFIAMLAYSQDLAASFSAVITMLSLLSAIVTTMLGIAIAGHNRRFGAPEIGGAIIGLGGCLMHSIGMAAYEPAGLVYIDAEFSHASILLGGLVGSLVLSVLLRMQSAHSKRLAAILLVACIVGLHFVAMASLTIVPYVTRAPAGLTRDALAAGVFVISALIIGVGFFATSIERRNKFRASHDVTFASHHDGLTGLPNRIYFEETLDNILEAARLKGRQLVVCKVNVVSLQEINEVLGGDGGDELLVEVSRRLKIALGPAAFLARMSGTRYAAVAECDDLSGAQAISAAIFETLSSSMKIADRTLKIRFCVGAAVFPRDGANQAILMGNANVALERARRLTGNCICFYDQANDQLTHRRRTLSQDMQLALERGQFELYFQPQFDVAAMEIIGFEGLLRWRHPQLGFVSPFEFIPIAEETGLIVPIGEWVLRNGCKIAALWGNELKVALNLSPVQLRSPDITETVIDAVRSSGLLFERLELEITESTLIENPEETLKRLRSLQDSGISVALDDFGSGYSSLGTLASFSFNKIKLDKSFLHEERPTKQAAALVGGLLKIGQKLGMKVLAEGIENEEQLAFLRAEGCDYGQGFLVGKPMPAHEISEWMSEFAARRSQREIAPTMVRAAS